MHLYCRAIDIYKPCSVGDLHYTYIHSLTQEGEGEEGEEGGCSRPSSCETVLMYSLFK